jgi:glycosyltransferase involved in cell wall biosynthesis
MRVGVAIPSYRGASLIEATLRSLLTQTHADWLCVVVNDGDEDGTAEVVRHLGDPRIRYVCDGNRRGQLRNFNRAILEVLGERPDIVRLLSADDVLYPDNLADVIRVFERNPRVGLVSSHFDGIDADGRLVFTVAMQGRPDVVMTGSDYLVKGVAVGNTIGGPSSVALRAEVVETGCLFDPSIDFCGDSDLWHRIAAHWDVAWVGGRAGFQYRFHDASVTGRDKHEVGRFVDKIQAVRRVAATVPLLGARWWLYQYTIGWLHAINVQVIVAMASKRRWNGVQAGLRGSLREGLLFYVPLWLPRIVWQAVRQLLGLPPTRRTFFRTLHERLQPPRTPVPSTPAQGTEVRQDTLAPTSQL